MTRITTIKLGVFPPSLMIVGMLSVFLVYSCSTSTGNICLEEVSSPCIPKDVPFQQLSEYNLFEGKLSELNPIDQLIPYDLNTPLFSDYAQKLRFVYVPVGKTVNYQEAGVLDFPVGSMLVKNFYYELDQQNSSPDRKIVETRLLIRYERGWNANTYVWNEEQNQASLKIVGDQKKVTWRDEEGDIREVNYLIPTKNDCKNCHSRNGILLPLGPKVNNLNKIYPYKEGPENQLVRWKEAGILHQLPDTPTIPELPVWNDPSTATIAERARAYLDVNCSNCHNPTGSANNSALYISLEEKNLFNLGICKPPVAPGPGSGGLRYGIVPCKPEESILLFRMESVEPEVRMPEIGRTLVHEEAVELIREWIENMGCSSCGNAD